MNDKVEFKPKPMGDDYYSRVCDNLALEGLCKLKDQCQALRDENERLKEELDRSVIKSFKDCDTVSETTKLQAENEQLRKELSNDTQTIATLEQQLFESTTKEIAGLKQQLAQRKPLDGDALYEVLCEHRENECALVEDARILVESICKHFGTGLKPLSYDKVRDIIVGGSAYSVNEVERIATEICKYSKTGGE